jgi:type I restriction enzyme M protein
MREVLERFDFNNTIQKLDGAGLLFLVVQRFRDIDLHPDQVPNHEMGTIFEELIRKFNEALDENPGEHFTAREVIRLMVDLMLGRDRAALERPHVVRTVYDPCCGTGGMLTIAKERIREWNPEAEVHLFGQEANLETWAVCKSDLLMSSADGRDADNIMGPDKSTLSNDLLADRRFDYLLANPPCGKDWKADLDAVRDEAARGAAGRFGAGLPRISNGQLLFLQHVLSRMKPAEDGGSRVAIVMNGSPLFTGDAGGGESEIRRWILENDWLEAIVAMPEQLFYNTGISTYVWVLTNRKDKARRGKVLLVDALSFWRPMMKRLGQKRRELGPEDIRRVTEIVDAFQDGEHARVDPTTFFGYRKITVEHPLRLNFQVSAERLARLREDKTFQALATSKKREPKAKAAEEAAGRGEQNAMLALLGSLPETLYRDRSAFEEVLGRVARAAGVKLKAPVAKAIVAALSERDETAEICRDKEGNPEPAPDLRDTENVPLSESVEAYFEREVRPHVPDAWINTAVRDLKDGHVGKVDYEVNFNRYFYRFQPPRPLEEIEADIRAVEKEILGMLGGVAD